MPEGTKIATCCYCGTRAALVLSGTVRHELACASCGAPLHDMKMLRADAVDAGAAIHRPAGARRAASATPLPVRETRADPRRVKKKKKRKSLAKRFFEEAFDAIEDIFD